MVKQKIRETGEFGLYLMNRYLLIINCRDIFLFNLKAEDAGNLQILATFASWGINVVCFHLALIVAFWGKF